MPTVLIASTKKLILFDISEAAYQIQRELENSQSKGETKLISLIGSVTDNALVKEAMTAHRPHTIFHAAAYKHVPLMEDNPIQAVKNNALGTLVIAEAALAASPSTRSYPQIKLLIPQT